jgi:hypothetical protein
MARTSSFDVEGSKLVVDHPERAFSVLCEFIADRSPAIP